MNSEISTGIPSPTTDLSAYLRAVHAFPLLSEEEERALAVRLREENDRDAAWRLVTSHLRYVAKIARGYRGYGLAEEDLIQEGNIGLMKAVRRFDPSVGVRLAAFAVHWIKAEIHEFVLRNWRIVKVATTKAQRKLFFNLRGAKSRLGWLSAEETEAVADDLNVRATDVTEMEQRLHAHDAPFDGAADADDDAAPAPAAMLADRTYDPGSVVEEDEWSDFAAARLADAMDSLDPRSRDIITRRWLMEDKSTLRELATEYGISAERVRQVEAQAMASLRAAVGDAVQPGAA